MPERHILTLFVRNHDDIATTTTSMAMFCQFYFDNIYALYGYNILERSLRSLIWTKLSNKLKIIATQFMFNDMGKKK
ncbi:hypothetical protein DERF_000319 [Dermatophagoides farinae]|uniref:Uncharacterized protein n=1 Tax=Dermatophagoides farinae TaxID=6954 RepID=A0A922I743_DERFA|nr:hypothetical protein DERF_000319 [Dermatophagoides farinae]